MKIVFATKNKNKVREIAAILKDMPVEFVSLDDYPNIPDTVEDGDTFEENAVKKAREAMEFTGLSALTDDSGLCVPALNGGPGIFSARFAGGEISYSQRATSFLSEAVWTKSRSVSVPKTRSSKASSES